MMPSTVKLVLSSGFRLGLPVGIALILVTNLVVLVGVASNRQGEATARLTLTERELRLRQSYDYENSGVSLRLEWGQTYGWSGYDWLTIAKLTELGFDVSVDPNSEEAEEFYRYPLPVEAWLVLEFNGAAWKKHLESLRADIRRYTPDISTDGDPDRRLAKARADLELAKAMGTRLLVVDAGLNPESLRKRYPHQDGHLVVRGEIGIRRLRDSPRAEIAGYVSSPLVTKLHVPLPYSKSLESLDDTVHQQPGPRYEVDVVYGSRSEPWIERLEIVSDGD
jgi:hypothetical protein